MEELPPVPAIPDSVNVAAAKARGGPKPKSLGIVTTPIRTASQKMAAKQGRDSGSWFGAAKVGDVGNVRTSDAIMSSPKVQTQTQPDSSPVQTPQENEGSPESHGSSINFSYPARVRVASPTPTHSPAPAPESQPKPKKTASTVSSPRRGSVKSASRPSSITSDQTLVYDPNSRRMVPRAELYAVEQALQVKPRKKKKSTLSRAGSHLARGTVGRVRGSAVDAGIGSSEAQAAAAASLTSHCAEEESQQTTPDPEPEPSPEEETQQVPEEPDERYEQPATETVAELPRLQTERVEEPRIHRTEMSMSPASNAPEVYPFLPETLEGGPQRRPSVVREEREEDSELESSAELDATPPTAAAALDAVPIRQSVYAHGVPSPPRSDNTDDQTAESTYQAPAELGTPSSTAHDPAPTRERPMYAEPRGNETFRRESRAQSPSPVRNARFGPVQDNLVVKHVPPSRSISPRKSALKRSPSRGASPSREAPGTSTFDTPAQEPPPQRKKSVRVSFDDENIVVVGQAAGRGEAESPVPPSPQLNPTGPRKPWYSSLGIGRKKGAVPLEEDEVMKPRPALPSFGSVRERKHSPKPADERPLVRPREPTLIEEGSEPPSPELEKKAAAGSPGQSGDDARNGVVPEQGPRIEANVSRLREPLPPVVTSIEGNGYISDTASSDEEAALLADTPRLEAEESYVSQASTAVTEFPKTDNGAVAADDSDGVNAKDFVDAPETNLEEVPTISLTQPSPQPEQKDSERTSYDHFPGAFPDTETETDYEHTPTRQDTFEPVVQNKDATATSHTPGTVLATQPAAQEPSDDSDGSSIYSDAYEDLSDIDGNGFQSLDAVVESPMLTTPPRNILEKAQAQRAEVVTPTPQSRRVKETSSAADSATTDPDDPWAAAKAYWRSLTAEKRAQLEREAAEEAGGDADAEAVQPEAKKPRRKKSVEKRNAEKKALELQRAGTDPRRSYMIKPGTKVGPDGYVVVDENATAPKQQRPAPAEADNNGMRLKKTMRGVDEKSSAVETGTDMRKTMRAPEEPAALQTGTRMRRSMRSDAAQPAATRQRPVSYQPAASIPDKSSNRHTRSVSENTAINQAMTGAVQPSLRRRGSDSSISSFKRARPESVGLGFGRKTMRTASVDAQEPREQQNSSRFSLRGASPPGSMGSRMRMRTTLRGDPSGRRASDDSGKGYLRFSGTFGRPLSEKKGKQRSSRFADDSSDEDEMVSRRFRSRFEDSSDEDMTPADLLPRLGPGNLKTMSKESKGVPSPPLPEELEDEYDGVGVGEDEKEQQVTTGFAGDMTTIRRQRSGRGADTARPSSRKSGFMSSVLRRNKRHKGGAKISRAEPTESAARRNTNLERTPEELASLRSNSLRASGRSPNLQRRVASFPSGTDTGWPLGDEPGREEDSHETGNVADARGESKERSPGILGHSQSLSALPRPGFRMRRTTSSTIGTTRTDGLGDVAATGGAGERKKKKFSALRKMFKLDD